MFFKSSELLELARKEHLRLMGEIQEKDAKIEELRDSAKIVREAIAVFCPPEMQNAAHKWMKNKGI